MTGRRKQAKQEIVQLRDVGMDSPAIASVVAQNEPWGSAAPGGGFAIMCSMSIQMPQSSTASRGGASPSLECVLREFVLDRGGGGGASRMHSSSSSSRSHAWLVSSFPRRGLSFSHCVRSIVAGRALSSIRSSTTSSLRPRSLI